MTLEKPYMLDFHPKAAKEFNKLDTPQKLQLLDKLEERLKNPVVPKDILRGEWDGHYKIKIQGLRSIYRINNDEKVVVVVVVGNRENDDVYKK